LRSRQSRSKYRIEFGAVLKQDWRDCGRIPTIVPCGREN